MLVGTESVTGGRQMLVGTDSVTGGRRMFLVQGVSLEEDRCWLVQIVSLEEDGCFWYRECHWRKTDAGWYRECHWRKTDVGWFPIRLVDVRPNNMLVYVYKLTCCHAEMEFVDQTFYLTQSQYTTLKLVVRGTWHVTRHVARDKRSMCCI